MGEETGEAAREVGGMMEGDVMEDDGEIDGVMGEKNEKK